MALERQAFVILINFSILDLLTDTAKQATIIPTAMGTISPQHKCLIILCKRSSTVQLKKHMKRIFFCVSFSIIVFNSGKAQANLTSKDSSVIGIWKGTSICQVKNSPCHDEIVIYHISKGEGIDTFNIRASKIVNGIEEDMGILPCKFERKRNQLISTANKGTWTFNVKDKSIDGTLILQGEVFRIIKLMKQD
jgi:hypothetical protein